MTNQLPNLPGINSANSLLFCYMAGNTKMTPRCIDTSECPPRIGTNKGRVALSACSLTLCLGVVK